MQSKAIKRQLLAAVAMVIVAAIALSSATYAWFAINSKVTATGMSFTTTVQDNLFIATAAHDDTTIKPEANFRTTEIQTVGGILEPVSTSTGMDFWYSKTNNVNGDGQVKNAEWVNYVSTAVAEGSDADSYTNLFSQNYGVKKNDTALAYIDYVYQIKAVAGADTKLNLTKLDLTYADQAAGQPNTSFRAAVFVSEATAPGGGAQNDGSNYSITASSGDENKTVPDTTANWVFTSSANGTTANGVNFTTNTTANAVVTGANTVVAASYKTDAANFNVTTGTHYYKVVVRVWLEGQDKNCNNTTFAKLDDGKWGLTTEWTLGNTAEITEQAVKFLKVTESLKSGINLTSDSASENKTVINGVTYYQLTDNTDYYVMGTGDGNATKPTTLKDQRIFTIVDGQITEVTHIVALPAPPASP